jgi:hypothetical protein
MRKTAIIVFSFFYLIIVTGIPVTIHYCQGSIESVQLFSSGNKSCCSGGLQKGCCKNVHFWIKAETENQLVSQAYAIAFFPLINAEAGLPVKNIPEVIIMTYTYGFHDLPPPGINPIWLVNCSLTYYG